MVQAGHQQIVPGLGGIGLDIGIVMGRDGRQGGQGLVPQRNGIALVVVHRIHRVILLGVVADDLLTDDLGIDARRIRRQRAPDSLDIHRPPVPDGLILLQ